MYETHFFESIYIGEKSCYWNATNDHIYIHMFMQVILLSLPRHLHQTLLHQPPATNIITNFPCEWRSNYKMLYSVKSFVYYITTKWNIKQE